MIKRAADGMVIRYGDNGAKLDGKELTKYMSQLNDYLGHFDKVSKKLRNEEVVQAFAEIFANEGKDAARRADFESPDKLKKMRARLNDLAKPYQFRSVSDVEKDPEHNLYFVSFTDAQGAPRTIGWTLAAAPESRQLLAKQAQLGDALHGPFLIEYAGKDAKADGKSAAPSQAELDEADEIEQEEGVNETIAAAPGTKDEAKPGKRNAKVAQDPVEKKTPREVFEYVIEQGRKEYQVQRYKGLGEMTAPQLWETTMDPARRTLLQVRLEDIAATEEIFTTLMGEDVEARRKFIEENALDVKNLDI
jgi:DNA gyrase subunit B